MPICMAACQCTQWSLRDGVIWSSFNAQHLVPCLQRRCSTNLVFLGLLYHMSVDLIPFDLDLFVVINSQGNIATGSLWIEEPAHTS